MPKLKGPITKLLRTREENKVFGLQVNGADYLFSWPDKREEPWNEPTKVGQVVEGTWTPYEKDGKEKRYLLSVDVLGEDVTPERNSFDEESEKQTDGQYRSPKDFRRTSALAQAVAYYANSPDVDIEEVVKAAGRFEVFLASGL